MNNIADDRVRPMLNPPRMGELIRESMDDLGWKVTETAVRMGCRRGTLSRLLNGTAGVCKHGAGPEGHRLRHRGQLDTHAGELQVGAGASGAGRFRTQRARMARMIESCTCAAGRLSCKGTRCPVEARPEQN